MTINPGDLVYIEASTGNSKNTRGEWENHTIKGVYEFISQNETTIYLREDDIFPVLRDKITKIEKK